MTFGQQLQQKGRLEGMQQTSEMIARDMLLEGFKFDTVEKITKLPRDIIVRLKKEAQL